MRIIRDRAAALLLTVGSLALLALWEAHKARQVSDRLGVAQTKLKVALNDALNAGQRAHAEAKNAAIAREHEKALLQKAQEATAQIEIQKQAASSAISIDALKSAFADINGALDDARNESCKPGDPAFAQTSGLLTDHSIPKPAFATYRGLIARWGAVRSRAAPR